MKTIFNTQDDVYGGDIVLKKRDRKFLGYVLISTKTFTDKPPVLTNEQAIKLADAIYEDLDKGWIPVEDEDRLPKESQNVSVCNKGDKKSKPAWFSKSPIYNPVYGDIYFYQNGYGILPDYWMPLPEPPDEP